MKDEEMCIRVWRWEDTPEEYQKHFNMTKALLSPEDIYIMAVPMPLLNLQFVYELRCMVAGTSAEVNLGFWTLIGFGAKETKSE